MYVSAKHIPPPERTDRSVDGRHDNVIQLPLADDGRRGASHATGADVVTQAGIAGDDVLVRAIAEGDGDAFAALMQRHLSAVLATARRLVRDQAEAEDIAQEAFLRLWDRAGELEIGEYGVRPWLRRVASNLAIDGLRKAKRLDVTDEVPEQADAPRQLQAMEAADVSSRVEQALSELPERQRIAVSLFHFDDLSQRDVAAMMEVSEDALESLLARGRRRLRELLKDEWQELLTDADED